MWRELELADKVAVNHAFQSIHNCYELRPHRLSSGLAAPRPPSGFTWVQWATSLRSTTPSRIVEETALLDQVTNGRFELGIVIGVYPEYFRVYKGDMENRRELGMEAIRLIKTAFGAEGNFSFKGPSTSTKMSSWQSDREGSLRGWMRHDAGSAN